MITFIQPTDLYSIRLEILRPNRDIESVKFPDDYKKGSFHLGYFEQEKLVGIASFSQQNLVLNLHEEIIAYQLRGMAVLNQYKGKNIGTKLCLCAENILKLMEISTIWCNARISAEGFYQKLQYTSIGDYFTIEDVGKHIVMYKYLK